MCRWRSGGRPACGGARPARLLDETGREYRILFTSWSATVIIASVMSGLAVSVLPECALRPGMRILGEADGFGQLPDCRIGIMRGHTSQPEIVDALARHISESLDKTSPSRPWPRKTNGFDLAAIAFGKGNRRLKPGNLMPGW